MPEVPEDVLVELRRICSALPEIVEDHTGNRATFKVARRVVVGVVTVNDGDGSAVTVMTARGDESELEFLAAAGHPFFRLRSPNSAGRIGVVIDDATDWSEITEIVIDSYLTSAPRRLTATLDLPAGE